MFNAINQKCVTDTEGTRDYLIEDFAGTVVGNQLETQLVFLKSNSNKGTEIFYEIENCLIKDITKNGKYLTLEDARNREDCYFRYPEDDQPTAIPEKAHGKNPSKEPKSKKFEIGQRRIPQKAWDQKYRK